MAVEIKEVVSKKDLKTFIYLPEIIHSNHKNWVPPIYLDEWDYFNPAKNKSFEHCEHILLLAYKDGRPVGRIMGLISNKYNKANNEQNGRFSYMETYNDLEVAEVLLSAIEKWCRSKGMVKLVGPLAFSDKDPQGMLIEGFDQPVVIASNCNFAYQVELLEKLSYSKETDLVVYQIKIPEQYPEIYKKIHDRFLKNQSNIRLLEFISRRAVKPYIHPVLKLVNETFSEIYGFLPFREEEMDDFANRYLYLINPRFIKVMVNENKEVVAFVIGMADIGKGLQKAGGHLLPFGFIHVLIAARRSKQLNLLLGGIQEKYRGRGLDVMMGAKLIESAKIKGKHTIDSHLELEDNYKVRAEMERMGGKVYKRYRIFQKAL